MASAVLARVNAWSLAAHQIGMQLFAFLAALAGGVVLGVVLMALEGVIPWPSPQIPG